MDTLVVLAYVFLIVVIAALAMIIIGIIRTRSCKILDVTGMILSMGIIALCVSVIYLYPNRSVADFVKPVMTARVLSGISRPTLKSVRRTKLAGKEIL